MQKKTNSAMSAIASISSVVNDIDVISQTIASAVEEQSATINEISQSVNFTSSSASEVAKNVSNSAQDIAEIERNMHRVNESANGTVSGIIQVKHNAEYLSKLSGALRELVVKFKI